MPRFTPQFIDRVRQANPVESVIGERVRLRKSGKNLKGLCPFHNEKTPSFTVSPDKGFFHCFGCGKGGNVFTFVMEYEGVSFPEAVESLAHRAGLPLEVAEGGAGGVEFAAQRRRRKDRLLELCKFAQRFFERQLYSTDAGRAVQEYMRERKINDEAARAFRLGYAPDGWDALRDAARKDGYTDDELVLVGLAVRSEDGKSVYDRFRGRLIFPVWDLAGNVIAFGGRVVGEGEPKYLNSPETPVYVKSKVLYPVHLTKRAIQQKGVAVLCEGYMDALALAQYRFTYVVASCGTALTAEQAHLLKRFTSKVIVAYDGDTAGQDATLKGASVLLEQGIDVFVAALSGGEDPDSFLKKRGVDEFRELLDSATPFFPYLLGRLKEKIDTRTPHGRRELCERVFPMLARFESEIIRGGYIDELAKFIDEDRERVAREFSEFVSRSRRRPERRASVSAAPAVSKLSPAEETFLAIILRSEQAVKYASENLELDYIEHPVAHELVGRMYDECRRDTWRGLEGFLDELTDEQAGLVTEILCRVPDSGENWKEVLEDCKNALYNRSYDSEIQRLRDELNSAPDDRKLEIVERIRSYQTEKRRHGRVKTMNIKSTV